MAKGTAVVAFADQVDMGTPCVASTFQSRMAIAQCWKFAMQGMVIVWSRIAHRGATAMDKERAVVGEVILPRLGFVKN